MRLRPFQDTLVTEVGLGCWQLGGDWGDVSDDDAMAILRAAHDGGVRFLDTADVYGAGRSEALIGRFLKTLPSADRPFVATKLGRLPIDGVSGMTSAYSEDVVRKAVDGSLRRLGVDALDLVQLHCLPMDVLRGDVWGWLGRLRDDGKVLRYGASVETVDEGLVAIEAGAASLQVIYDVFRQSPADVLLPAAKAAGVAIIVRLPLASGLLTGKLSRQTSFAPTDHRSYNRDGAAFHVGETFAGIPYDVAVDLVDELRRLVPEGYSMAEMALRWCLDDPAVTTIIPGASRPTQAAANARASDLRPLDPAVHARLRRFYDERVAGHVRGHV